VTTRPAASVSAFFNPARFASRGAYLSEARRFRFLFAPLGADSPAAFLLAMIGCTG
jgi:hypothetical protein